MTRSGFVVLLAVSATQLAALDDPVPIASGFVTGTTDKMPDVRVYRGIPYAAPPVGNLRWKPPQPPAPWTSVYAATGFGPSCMQTPYPKRSIFSAFSPPLGPVSEDCLTLNIWTAAKTPHDRRPVMVWIYGGAFTRGSSSLPSYDGAALAHKGVVLVTINYRLGVFGFLAHPGLTAESPHHSSGNYGILDQIAALQWVRHNIAAFGGDPKRVTVFGESAGSWAVNCLMASPLAKGLFQRAIGESGGLFNPTRPLSEAEQEGEKFAASIGASDIKSLRAKSAEDLLAAKWSGDPRPAVDGWLLPKDIYTIFSEGKENKVPLIAGSNADEGSVLSRWTAKDNAATFRERAQARYGSHAAEFLKLYPAATDEQARDSHYRAFRDEFFWQMHTWARLVSAHSREPAYLYQFTRASRGPLAPFGAFHASEIAFVFGNHSAVRPWNGDDQKLADAMSAYWVQFATTGNPNGGDLPKWPAYEAKEDALLELGDQIETVSHLHSSEIAFLDAFFAPERK